MSYDDSWDHPHAPVDHPLWQESDCYWFWDAKRGIGGFHRVGQTPASGAGMVTLFVFEQGGQRFRHVGDHPLAADARSESGRRRSRHSVPRACASAGAKPTAKGT